MSWLFSASPRSYADEQLNSHLASIATIPVTFATTSFDGKEQDAPIAEPSPHLQQALRELSGTKMVTPWRLAEILQTVSEPDAQRARSQAVSEVDQAAEAEIMTRAVSVVWAHVMEVFVDGALSLEDDKVYWDMALASRSGTIVYLVQSLPARIWHAISTSAMSGSFVSRVKAIHWPQRGQLFRSLSRTGISAELSALASPLVLTRREMLGNRRVLTDARNAAAQRVGLLASKGPNWSRQEVSTSVTSNDLMGEASRVYQVVCEVLDVRSIKEAQAESSTRETSSRSKRSRGRSVAFAETATPATLLEVLNTYLPTAQGHIQSTLSMYGRPSPLTRLWFGFIFAPPALYFAASAIVRNKDWMKEQVLLAKETVKGFLVQWVWEPIEDIAKTMRGGGEGLAFAPETVQQDQESLERMVVDLGRDYYHLSGAGLEDLKAKVEAGDVEPVLKVYEDEMRHPIKNAIFGYLIRTLLIQVQKTKTDLSISLLRLDQLLRSQQLTFAFVGVAPSVLLLWAIWGWLSAAYKGDKRGKDRRRRYFTSLRAVEKLLLEAPDDDARMSDQDRGLVIVTVSGLRTWATGLGSSRRQMFLGDLRMVEDQLLTRLDKLRVVERMWRSWGMDGCRRIG